MRREAPRLIAKKKSKAGDLSQRYIDSTIAFSCDGERVTPDILNEIEMNIK